MIFIMINGWSSFLAFAAFIQESIDLEVFVRLLSIKSASFLTAELYFLIIALKSGHSSTSQTSGSGISLNGDSNCPNGTLLAFSGLGVSNESSSKFPGGGAVPKNRVSFPLTDAESLEFEASPFFEDDILIFDFPFNVAQTQNQVNII